MMSDSAQLKRYLRIGTRLRHWLEHFDEESESVLPEVNELTDNELGRLASLRLDVVTPESIRTIIDRAHALIGRHPRLAATWCETAIRLAERVDTGDPDEDMGLEGDAWREHASALYSATDYKRALRSCKMAAMYYDVVKPKRDFGNAILALILGQVMHCLGDSDAGIALIDQTAPLFLRLFNNKKKYIEARTIAAVVRLQREEWNEALEALKESAALARKEKDTSSLAWILSNIGCCYANMGRLRQAQQCLITAIKMFERDGLTADLTRTRGSLVLVLRGRGRYNEAISELYQLRATYLSLDMPIAAAESGLRIVEILFLAGRAADAPALCQELYSTFTEADVLPNEARKALAYLNAAAIRCEATDELLKDVEHVIGYWERLMADPGETFVERLVS
jgi:tetratricopeptide (TPR) repeat protein